MRNLCKSEFCLRKYLIGVLIAVTISVGLAGCRNKKMTPKRATEFTTDRLNLSEEQSQKIVPIAEDLFLERESLQEIKKAINGEILAQIESETGDATKLEAVFNRKHRSTTIQVSNIHWQFRRIPCHIDSGTTGGNCGKNGKAL